jgi:hypothetical protein
MDLLVPVSLLLALEAAVLLLFLRYRASRKEAACLNPDWLYQLSVDRYRPMLRLLDERDFLMLRSQPGFTPDMTERVRLQRCKIFSQYLSSLNSDFQKVVASLKMLMVQSSQDRPDLARVLLRMQFTFALRMLIIRLRLVLYRWGLAKVDSSPLIGMFEFLRGKLQVLAPLEEAC